MKGFLLSVILLGGTLLMNSCSHQLAPAGHYQNDSLTIDGNINDWPLPLRFSNAEYTMHYSITNNNQNIYICVYSKDPAFQKRMLRSGMSIYFDPKGEKNKTIALIFPVKKPTDPNNYRSVSNNQLLLQSDYYNTIGFLNMENGQYDIHASQNKIQVAIQLGADSSLVYEAAVPIAYILGKDLTAGNANRNFSVDISLDASSTPSRNNGYSSHGSHGGGMGGMHGMGGTRNYGQSGHPAQKAEDNWYSFQPVYKKL